MPEEVIHRTINGKYRLQIERSAVKGVDGFKCEANGDAIEEVERDAQRLYDIALKMTEIKITTE